MCEIKLASQFKQDYKKLDCEKGLDDLPEKAIDLPSTGQSSNARLRDHPFKAGYVGCREFHFKPDLLVIYVQTDEELQLVSLGRHSDLFEWVEFTAQIGDYH